MSAEQGADADVVLDAVRALLAELRRAEPPTVGLDSDLASDLGLDSLTVVELYDRLQEIFDVTLPEETLATARTPGDWLRAVRAERGRPTPAGGDRSAVATAAPVARRAGEPWPEAAATLNEALAWHVEQHPDLTTVRILGAHGSPAEELTYGDLAAQGTALAHGLVADGLCPGERVAIMLPTGREYFVTFLGILLARAVPVPIYPPARPAVLEEHLGRQARLLANAGASTLVTVPEARVAARLLRAHVPSLRAIHTVDSLVDGGRPSRRLSPAAPGDIALIQYTSGSTGDPRGVVLTHTQLLANVHSMGRAVDVRTDDVFVSWLPLYHDMGLIGAWHAGLIFGFPLVILSPLQFLARPASWLEAITRYSGTISAAPNFAYQSCVDRIGDAELAGFDLSSWRLAIDGSEPVSPLTSERFIDRFAACGFRREALSPAYGLAEVGLGLTVTPLGRGMRIDRILRSPLEASGLATPATPGDPGGLAVVGCGAPFPDYEVRVIDPGGNPLPERHEGTVVCRGPSAADHYFDNEPATRTLWRHGWLDTGDLGYLSEGELFLTGRAKDLIIRGGRNIHPEDLEQALGELGGVRGDQVAVLAGSDPRRGTERLVVVVESDLAPGPERQALRDAIARKAADVLELAPDEIVLAPGGAIVRTPSGKIRRAATWEALEAGVLGRPRAPVAVQLVRFGWSGVGLTAAQLRRRLAPSVFAAYAWALVVMVALPLWVAVHLPSTLRARWAIARAAGRSLQALGGIDLQVHGAFPAAGTPVVVVSNHASFIDAAALVLASADPVVFVTSTDLEHHWAIGSFLRRLGCAFVHRGEAEQSREDVEHLVDLVRRGQRLMVFPEGSIDRDPGLRPFHLGAFAVASEVGCPVVPVGIWGSRALIEPGSFVPHPSSLDIRIGLPIEPSGSDFAATAELAARTRSAVAELSGQPLVA